MGLSDALSVRMRLLETNHAVCQTLCLSVGHPLDARLQPHSRRERYTFWREPVNCPVCPYPVQSAMVCATVQRSLLSGVDVCPGNIDA